MSKHKSAAQAPAAYTVQPAPLRVYTLQYNVDQDSFTVFDRNEDWVGVFRTESQAFRFVSLVLKGQLDDGSADEADWYAELERGYSQDRI